jgi:hypothetical protein
MKVKLLKKVRKRYTITHYPNGLYMDTSFYRGPQTLLVDNYNDWRMSTSQLPRKEAYEVLYLRMIDWIQKDYGPSKGRLKKLTSENLWYKK